MKAASPAPRAALRIGAVLGVLIILAWPGIGSARAAQIECGEYEGVVCQGFFTDEAGVATDPQQIEDAIDRLVGEYGNPIAIVVVNDSRGRSPATFAVDLANAWGVGDPVEDNGVLVLVSLDERRTEVVTQDNVDVPGDIVAGSARSFFAAGDFQGGLLAIVGTTEQALAGTLTQSGDGVGRVWPFVVGLLVAGLAVTVVGVIIGNRRRRARSVQRTPRSPDRRGSPPPRTKRRGAAPSVGLRGCRSEGTRRRHGHGAAGHLRPATRRTVAGRRRAASALDQRRRDRRRSRPFDRRHPRAARAARLGRATDPGERGPAGRPGRPRRRLAGIHGVHRPPGRSRAARRFAPTPPSRRGTSPNRRHAGGPTRVDHHRAGDPDRAGAAVLPFRACARSAGFTRRVDRRDGRRLRDCRNQGSPTGEPVRSASRLYDPSGRGRRPGRSR